MKLALSAYSHALDIMTSSFHATLACLSAWPPHRYILDWCTYRVPSPRKPHTLSHTHTHAHAHTHTHTHAHTHFSLYSFCSCSYRERTKRIERTVCVCVCVCVCVRVRVYECERV